MADKRRAAKEKTDRGIDAALRDLPRRGVQNPLLTSYLRKDAAKTAAGERFRKFREEDLATRYAKRGETSGLLDLLTFFPAGRAASALKAGERLPAALAGTEFLSQFSDDPLSRLVGETLALAPTTRGLSKLAAGTRGAEYTKRLGQDWLGGTVGGAAGTLAGLNMRPEGRDGENLAAYPVYSVGSLRRLAAVADRVAKTGKDFPMFTAEGKMSPARQKELFRRMEEWIPNTSTKKPEAVLQDLRDWIAATKGAGKKPVEKRIILDRMPASLSEAFQQSLKEMGYGGMDRGPRSKAPMDKFGTRVTKGQNLAALEAEGKYTSGGRMNPTQVATEGPKTWEELKPREQAGFTHQDKPVTWVTRPGEVLEPGKKPFRRDLFKTAAGAGLLGAALAGQDTGSEDSQAGLVLNRRNLAELRRRFEANLKELNKQRPGFEQTNRGEAFIKAKYPKIYSNLVSNRPVVVEPDFDGYSGGYDPISQTTYMSAIPDRNIPAKDRLAANKVSAEIIAHEGMHAADFRRILSDLQTPGGKRILLSDFTPDNRETDYMKAAYRNLPGISRQNKEDIGLFPNTRGKYSAGGTYEEYAAQPIEQRAFGAGNRGAESLQKFLEMLENNKAAAAGASSALAAGMFTNPESSSEDSQAAVPGWKKLQRAVALARSGRLADPIPYDRVPGSVKGLDDALKVQRAENLADVTPSPLQRRGLYYTLAEPPRYNFQMERPSSAYQNSYSSLTNPGSEGGSRGVLGAIQPRNPLLLNTTSFYGYEAPDILGKGRKVSRANSWEELNKALPKKYRLNNTDIRNFKSDPNRDYKWNDTIGDLVLSKYMKKEGFDAGIPRAMRERLVKNKPAYQREVVFPSESRWDRAPQFTSNWKTLADYAAAGPELTPTDQLKMLKRGVQPGAPTQSTAAATGASKVNQFANALGVSIPQKPIAPDISALAKKPKMTKAERIAKWGNPGIKMPYGSVYFTDPEDFLNYRLPNSSYMAAKYPSGWAVDPNSPLTQSFSLYAGTGSGGPKIAPGTPSKVALDLAKKGAKPYSLAYSAEEGAPKDIIEELKKYFEVWEK